jgi:hypothetical protein
MKRCESELKPGNIVLIAAGAGVVQYRFRARVDKQFRKPAVCVLARKATSE